MTTIKAKRWGLLASCVMLSGCLPIAFVTPPMRVGLTGGVHHTSGQEATREGLDASPAGFGTQLALEGAIAPLQLWGQEDRLLDLGAGYGVQLRAGATPNTHGPFIEFGALLSSPQLIGRHGLRLQSRALMSSADDALSGFGASLSWTWEGVGWSTGDDFSSCDSEGCIAGLAYGEGGIGLEVSLGVDRVRRATDMSLNVGMIIRIPASIGAGFVWLL